MFAELERDTIFGAALSSNTNAVLFAISRERRRIAFNAVLRGKPRLVRVLAAVRRIQFSECSYSAAFACSFFARLAFSLASFF